MAAACFLFFLVIPVFCARQLTCNGTCQQADLHAFGINKVMPMKEVQHQYCVASGECPTNKYPVVGRPVSCENGFIAVHDNYQCSNVNLRSYLPNSKLGTTHDANDIWGAQLYDARGTLRFLAIVGLEDGTSFVDITNSLRPIVLGFLPSHACDDCTTVSIWRDVKVYQNHAFIVSENRGHGMQVINLENLVNTNPSSAILSEDAHYGQFGNAHNIALNVDSGYAYAVGTRTCNGGLHIVDVRSPLDPVFAGCFAADGYTHDTQCVNYDAPYPDTRYYGREICFNYNEDTLTIVDVTDKDDIQMVSRTGYKGFQYTHQGWMTEDGQYLFMDDELDELYGSTFPGNSALDDSGSRTRTLIWDAKDLQNPRWVNSFFSKKTVIDHNMYINHGLGFQSNYCGGLRVLNVKNPLDVTEHGYLDVAPACDGPIFQGSWSNYPFYVNHPDDVPGQTQIVVVTSIERGLYVTQVNLE